MVNRNDKLLEASLHVAGKHTGMPYSAARDNSKLQQRLLARSVLQDLYVIVLLGNVPATS